MSVRNHQLDGTGERAADIASAAGVRAARRCFWCDGPGPLTRDHVVPYSVGGGFADNIVPACQACNDERAVIARHHGQARTLRRLLPGWAGLPFPERTQARRIRRSVDREAALVYRLVEKWQAIEESRWGWSPSAALDLTLPHLPTEKSLRKAAGQPEKSEAAT